MKIFYYLINFFLFFFSPRNQFTASRRRRRRRRGNFHFNRRTENLKRSRTGEVPSRRGFGPERDRVQKGVIKHFQRRIIIKRFHGARTEFQRSDILSSYYKGCFKGTVLLIPLSLCLSTHINVYV